jgi:hypothetical protein
MSFLQTSGRSLILSCLLLAAGCGMRSTVTADADDPSLSQAGAAGGPLLQRDAGPIDDPDGFGGIGTNPGTGPCGNGGDCDPNDLGGENCNSLNAGRGRLACDPITCTFDLSMCSGGPGTFGGGGTNGGGGTDGGGNGGLFGGGTAGGGGTDGGGNGGFFGGGTAGGGGTDGGGNAGGFFGGGNGGGGGTDGGGNAGGGFFGGGNAGGGFFGGGENNGGN